MHSIYVIPLCPLDPGLSPAILLPKLQRPPRPARLFLPPQVHAPDLARDGLGQVGELDDADALVGCELVAGVAENRCGGGIGPVITLAASLL